MSIIGRTGIAIAMVVVFGGGQQLMAMPWSGAARARTLQTLRTTDADLAQLIEYGLSHSLTLRRLQARLEECPVIVYLARARLPSGMWGRTRLIGKGGDAWRFLLVELDDRIRLLDQLSVLGHELQHAIEIADASEVVDVESLAALYRRIGREDHPDGPDAPTRAFETREAIKTGRRVRAELSAWGQILN